MKKAVLILSWVLLAIQCHAEIITVDDDGPADFNNIQAAIDDANDGDTVIVKDGVYKGLGNRDIDFKNKAITVQSTDPNDPNIVATTIIDCDANISDRHRGFVFHSGEDSNSVLAGLTITNGYAYDGAGIRCSYSSPTITNCLITANTTYEGGPWPWGFWSGGGGGGIYCYESSPTINNCIISGNRTYDLGGAILCRGGSPVIKNCIITRNQASYGGGAIGCDRAYPAIINCIISYNDSRYHGGGIFCSSAYSITRPPVIVSNCTFIGNWALRDGGAIEGWGNTFAITDCDFSWNGAESGGGAMSYCHGYIRNCVVRTNSAGYYGGAFYVCTAEISNSIVLGNWAGQNGGGLYTDRSYMGRPDIRNCTFSKNSAGGHAGGIYHECGWFGWSCGGINVTNCILWGNRDSSGTGETAQIEGVLPGVTFSCIQDDDPNDANIPFGGEANNNIDDNPMFVSEANDGGDGWGDDPCTPDVNEGANDDFGDLHFGSGGQARRRGSVGKREFA
ncbi:MAG: right-handed parallel beta-helix repeat-containing protein [Planctomycetota bacterium]|jgi:hypothetical protein